MEQNRNSRWPRNLFLAVTVLLELLFSMADTAPSLLQEGTKASETCSFSFTDLNGTLASPNYPGDYPNNVFCSWEIDVTDVDEGSTITLVFEEFHLENSQGCEKDYVEVYDGANYHLFCGREIPPVIVSIGSVMSVALVTDEDIHVGHKFLAHYSTSPALNTTTTPWNISSTTDANWPTTDPNDNCGEVLELDNSYVWRIFYSPQHEGPYPSLINCTWTFINNLHEQYETRVVFLRLDLDTDEEEDFVGFWNGTDELRRFSGNYHHTGIYNDTIATPALRNEGWETTVTFHAEPPSSWNATGFLFAVTRALSEDPTTASNKNHRTSNDDAGEIIDGASLTKIGPAKPSDNLHERFQRNQRNATMVVDINMVTGKITSSGRHGRALACFGDCSRKVDKAHQDDGKQDFGFFWSPNHPDRYENEDFVVYTILAPEGRQIAINLIRFETESCSDYLVLQDLITGWTDYTCGAPDSIHGYTSVSESHSLKASFSTDDSIRKTGFLAVFASVEMKN